MLDAVRVATSPEAVGMGTTVVMNGRIEAAREVTKTSTLNVETFQTREFGSLGVADLGAVRFYRAPLRRQTIPLSPDAVLPRVEIVSMYAGADGRVIDALLATGELEGLVIAGLGLAHVPEAAMESIRAVRERGVPVVLSTRVQVPRPPRPPLPCVPRPPGRVSRRQCTGGPPRLQPARRRQRRMR